MSTSISSFARTGRATDKKSRKTEAVAKKFMMTSWKGQDASEKAGANEEEGMEAVSCDGMEGCGVGEGGGGEAYL